MALFACHYFSPVLRSNTSVNIILPTPEDGNSFRQQKPLPVLYLLHGAFGDCTSWCRNSKIERYVQEQPHCVVMASAENSFYQNMEHGKAFRTFFTEELPRFVTDLFPVSGEREDTAVAGLSMGGYGAWFLALSRPDLYSAAASLSGALDIVRVRADIAGNTMEGPFPWNDIFRDPDALAGGPADLFALYENCRKKGQLPRLYQACGTEDFLYRINTEVKSRLEALGAPLTYEEGPGIHDWNFWDEYIRHVLNWLEK